MAVINPWERPDAAGVNVNIYLKQATAEEIEIHKKQGGVEALDEIALAGPGDRHFGSEMKVRDLPLIPDKF